LSFHLAMHKCFAIDIMPCGLTTMRSLFIYGKSHLLQ